MSAKLESVYKFNIFNVFSFLGMLYEGLVIYVLYSIALVISYNTNRALFFACADVAIITLVCIIFAILATRKHKDFFD